MPSSEVTQEIGSRGLVLVYEQGDEETRKELVEMLMQTMSVGKKTFKKTHGTVFFISLQSAI
jgi:hypothetical protein